MKKECEYPISEKNHVISIGNYFAEKAIESISQATGGRRVLMEPVPLEERTPNKSKK